MGTTQEGTSYWQRVASQFPPGRRFLFAGLFFVLGFAMTVGPIAESQETRLLEEEGETVAAEVVSTNTRSQRLRIIEVSSRVRFSTASGETFEETITDCGSREPEAPGTVVEVRVFNRHGIDKDERAMAIEREESSACPGAGSRDRRKTNRNTN